MVTFSVDNYRFQSIYRIIPRNIGTKGEKVYSPLTQQKIMQNVLTKLTLFDHQVLMHIKSVL